MTKFNPNDLKQKNVWGTYIPGRIPNFKTHSNRGHAISALKDKAVYKKIPGQHQDYKILTIKEEITLWKFVDNKWEEVEFERDFPVKQKGLVFK